MIYDKNSKCYTYKGNVVRFFNDPVGGASFTNFFTGTVDIEAERDTNINLLVFGNAQKKFMTGIQKSMKIQDLNQCPLALLQKMEI